MTDYSTKEKFLQSLRSSEPVVTEPTPEPTPDPVSDGRPEIPSWSPVDERPDIEDELSSIAGIDEAAIDAQRAAAKKKIQTKQLLSKLVDAVALGVAAKQGVTSDLKLTDIDTSMDEREMDSDTNYGRSKLRDKLRQLRQDSRQKYEDQKQADSGEYRHEWATYNAEVSKIRENQRLSDAEKKAAEDKLRQELKSAEAIRKAEVSAEKEAARRAKEKVTMASMVNRETTRISKIVKEAMDQYKEDGDEDGFFSALDMGNVGLDDDDKAAMLEKNDFWWDDILEPDNKWMRSKANKNLGMQARVAGKKALVEREEYPKKMRKDGDVADIESAEAEAEARKEGWE